MYMHISLIIVSIFYVEVAESISCFNCVSTNNDAQSGQANTCGVSGPTCMGDFCLVTALYYSDYNAPSPITITWRQCGKSVSLPSGVNTSQCIENGAAFKESLNWDGNGLCCYERYYNQTYHRSSVTYCFCTSDNCNLKNPTNFSPPPTTPTVSPGSSPAGPSGSSPTMPSVPNPSVPSVPNPSVPSVPNPSVPSVPNPSATTVTDINLSGILVSVYVIPIASTAVVSVLMILMAVCLWRMS